MTITGLDIALQRINQIERNFSDIAKTADPTLVQDSSKMNFEAVLTDRINNKTSFIRNNPYATSALSNTSSANTSALEAPRVSTNGRFDHLVKAMSNKYNVDENLINGVIKAESGFNPRAVSKVGAKGLMQLMPATAKHLGVTDVFDPAQNIEGGTKYLKRMLDKYGGNKELALAAYNAGPGAVDRYGGVPPYRETQQYVKRILGG